MLANQVKDTARRAVVARNLGTFGVNITGRRVSVDERHVPLRLVRSFLMIVLHVLPRQIVQMRLAEYHKLIQALLLNALDETVHIGI